MTAAALASNVPPTALEKGVQRLGSDHGLTLFLTLFVLRRIWPPTPPLHRFCSPFSALTPELLPMVMTVTLARRAADGGARQVIVKRLSAIHDFGAMDVLCVDKTGTLTQAKISLAMHVDSEGRPSDRLLEHATVNAHFQSGMRSPLDEAILQAGRELELSPWTRRDELAFDSNRRCLSVSAGGRTP
jgi:Mg2+-importing ATPase